MTVCPSCGVETAYKTMCSQCGASFTDEHGDVGLAARDTDNPWKGAWVTAALWLSLATVVCLAAAPFAYPLFLLGAFVGLGSLVSWVGAVVNEVWKGRPGQAVKFLMVAALFGLVAYFLLPFLIWAYV